MIGGRRDSTTTFLERRLRWAFEKLCLLISKVAGLRLSIGDGPNDGDDDDDDIAPPPPANVETEGERGNPAR